MAAVEKLVGALYQVQAAMAQLTASVTNLLRLKVRIEEYQQDCSQLGLDAVHKSALLSGLDTPVTGSDQGSQEGRSSTARGHLC